MAHDRLYASALADVRYIFGKPIPFDAKLARRMAGKDTDDRKAAWADAERRYG